MSSTVLIEFQNMTNGSVTELEVPLDITANDLIIALNETYGLQMNVDNILECHLVAENPICFLRGNRTLEEFGIRDGSIIIFRRS